MTASLDKQPLLGNRLSVRVLWAVQTRKERKRERELVVIGEPAIKVLTTNGKPQNCCHSPPCQRSSAFPDGHLQL